MEKIQMNLPKAAGKKKGSSSKPAINGFILAIGDSVKVDYTIEEENKSYNYSVSLSSGDAFALNNEVRGFAYGVTNIEPQSSPKGLVIREGTLLISVERD